MSAPRLCRCPHCGRTPKFFCDATDENRRSTAARFAYWMCTSCGLIWLDNVPDDLRPYYGTEYYAIPDAARLEQLASREDAKMAAITPFAKGRRLLEVGPAFGVFAARARRDGFEVAVIEQDRRCCDYLQHTVGVDVTCADDPEAELKARLPYDVIAAWHVIEHLRDPLGFFDAAAASLKPCGILALATPNPGAWQAKIMGRAWPHLDAPRHLYLLPSSVLVERGRARGLEVCLLTTNDADAKRWNRFGWQRLLANRLPGRAGRWLGLASGAGVAALTAPFESRALCGSAYTLVMKRIA